MGRARSGTDIRREILSGRYLFVLIIGALALFLLAMGYLVYNTGAREDSFELHSRQYLQRHTARNALLPIIEALEQVHWQSLDENRQLLQRAALENENLNSPTLDALVQRHQGTIASISRSAEIPIVALPSTENATFDTAQPRIDDMQNLGFLLVANAKRIAAEGRPEEALQRLMETALLGSRFCRPQSEASLARHIVGMTLIEMAVTSMQRLLQDPTLDEETRRRIAAQLLQLEDNIAPVEEALWADSELFEREISSRVEDPAKLAQALRIVRPNATQSENIEAARELSGEPAPFIAASNELQEKLRGALADANRPMINAAWFEEASGHSLLKDQFTEWSAVISRETTIRARIRLTAALALAAGSDQVSSNDLLDPFDGQPLRRADGRIYSIGPDGVDNGGESLFDPGKGPFSIGDIVVQVSSVDYEVDSTATNRE